MLPSSGVSASFAPARQDVADDTSPAGRPGARSGDERVSSWKHRAARTTPRGPGVGGRRGSLVAGAAHGSRFGRDGDAGGTCLSAAGASLRRPSRGRHVHHIGDRNNARGGHDDASGRPRGPGRAQQSRGTMSRYDRTTVSTAERDHGQVIDERHGTDETAADPSAGPSGPGGRGTRPAPGAPARVPRRCLEAHLGTTWSGGHGRPAGGGRATSSSRPGDAVRPLLCVAGPRW